MKVLTTPAIAVMAAVMAAALAVPAYSQGMSMGSPRKEEPKVDPEKKKSEDKMYNDALSRMPAKEYDPWAAVREKEKPPAPQKKPSR